MVTNIQNGLNSGYCSCQCLNKCLGIDVISKNKKNRALLEVTLYIHPWKYLDYKLVFLIYFLIQFKYDIFCAKSKSLKYYFLPYNITGYVLFVFSTVVSH